MSTYLINQRVIVSGEIGTVRPPDGTTQPDQVRVFRPSNQYASNYAAHNVKALPGGQL